MNDTRASRKLVWRQTFSSLKHRNYRLWFWGQMVSLFGTWMQTTAQGFLMFQLTHSPASLGYIGFAYGIPSWFFMLYGGVIADRMSRRTLLLMTQSVMMVLAFILAILTYADIVQPWHILVLAFGLGSANAFDAPARNAFVAEIVSREDLTNAVALNASVFHAAIAVGPAVAGFIYAAMGPAWCFTINGISFIAVIAALKAMRLQPHTQSTKHSSTLSALAESIHYVHHHSIIRTIIGLVATTSLFGISLGTLLPAWSVKILHGDAATNGLLYSARGFGSLVGSLGIAYLGANIHRGKLISFGSLFFPAFIALFALAHHITLSVLLMIFIGITMIMVLNLSNAMIQSLVPDSLRGRVMGVYSTIFMGSMPLGALLFGTIAEHTGEAEAALFCACTAFCIAGLVWIFMPKMRSLN